MNSVVATTLTALWLSLPIGLASSVAPAAQEDGNCVSSRQAQEAVEAGEILDLSSAAQREGIDRKFIGDEARLCDVEGSPHWVVNVMSESGDSERIVLNAQGD
jgi:hypothetical protein